MSHSQSLHDELPMGFLARETKIPEVKRAGENVPLTYLGSSLTKFKPNFAPFNYTERRDLSPAREQAPPPGTYNVSGTLEDKTVPASAHFKSKSIRFVPDKADEFPGPGYYTLKSYVNPGHPKQLPKPTVVKQAELGLTSELRSAPSIPNKHQGYGYETRGGKLVPQQPLKPGFSGVGSDKVGPGDYDPPVKLTKGPSAVFGKVSKTLINTVLINLQVLCLYLNSHNTIFLF